MNTQNTTHAANPENRFKIDERVMVNSVGVAATIVGFEGSLCLVAYDDMPHDDNGNPFKVPSSSVSPLNDDLGTALARIKELEAQVAELIKERGALRATLHNIRNYKTKSLMPHVEDLKRMATRALNPNSK